MSRYRMVPIRCELLRVREPYGLCKYADRLIVHVRLARRDEGLVSICLPTPDLHFCSHERNKIGITMAAISTTV